MSIEQYSPTGFNFLPPVVKNLLIINGLFFLASISLKNAHIIDLNTYLGLFYVGSPLFRPFQFVSYMFMHADFPHILYNMFAVWMFGYLLENAWGSKKFLTFYMITGIGAGIIQTLVQYWHFSSLEASALTFAQAPNLDAFIRFIHSNAHLDGENSRMIADFISQWKLSPENPILIGQSVNYANEIANYGMDIPTIGASGAVFGILLAFGMMFPNMMVYLFFVLPLKAKYVVIGYGAMELFSGISNDPNDNVAHFAHLGGMLFGFLLILYWRKKSAYR